MHSEGMSLISSLSVMQWLGSIPLHSFDKKTPTVEEVKESAVKHKTAESTTSEANHVV